MSTSLDDFFLLVAQMRECQKRYFRTRSRSALKAAKLSEAVVDAFIENKRAEWARAKQPELMVFSHLSEREQEGAAS